MPINRGILKELQRRKSIQQKSLAVLLDPDELSAESLKVKLNEMNRIGVDFIFFGGSLVHSDLGSKYISYIKANSEIPVVIFPGSHSQIYPEADAILLLNLISGRNPEYLIGQHVQAAYQLHTSGLELISTSYMLVNSGRETTASYISNTSPIPHDKPQIACATAMAGEQIGHQVCFMDGGSGAMNPISNDMVEKVSKVRNTPLIVGGGIKSGEKLRTVLEAGADVVVVGNALEDNFMLLDSLQREVNSISNVKLS